MRRVQDRARSATIESRARGALKLASEARDENVPAKRADFFRSKCSNTVCQQHSKIGYTCFSCIPKNQ